MSSESPSPLPISIWLAIVPVVVLVSLLGLSVYYFADDSSYGANQIALLTATAIAAFIGIKLGYSWNDMEQSIIKGISHSMIAILILLVVGSLIGSWMLSGTVQTMIYYGLQLISADWFYAAACLVCGISALSIGSSWTVAANVAAKLLLKSPGPDLVDLDTVAPSHLSPHLGRSGDDLLNPHLCIGSAAASSGSVAASIG